MRRRSFFFCRSDPCSSSVAAANSRTPDFATPTAPTAANSSSTTRARLTGRPRPYHASGHCGIPHPESASLFRHVTNDISGSQFAASHARTSVRTCSSLTLLIESNSPTLHQELTVIARLTEKHFGTFRALEPQMSIVVPGKADTAVNLNAFGRAAQVSFRRRSLGEAGECGPFGIVHRAGLRRAVSR